MATIPPEKMKAYIESARAREAVQKQAAMQRREAAWAVARQAAGILKSEFGATRVVVFGSLSHGAWFNARSDIDLLAEGIPPDLFWRAWCALDRLGSQFQVDLVPGETIAGRLREEVEREGVEL